MTVSIRDRERHMLRARSLSRGETDVLDLIMQGMQRREIMERLCIAPGTYQQRCFRLRAKLGARTLAQAVAIRMLQIQRTAMTAGLSY